VTKFSPAENVWCCNAPLGKHKSENLLSDLSKTAGLATIYTLHCFRATSVTILKASGLENAYPSSRGLFDLARKIEETSTRRVENAGVKSGGDRP